MATTYEAPQAAVAPSTAQRNLRIDPVTRVSGPLALHAAADWGERTVANAVAMATAFRGYENVLVGRDARDAVFVSSRACGVCGSAHSIAAAQALEMACGIEPPQMAIVTRNIMSAVECMIDHPSHLFLRAGPDYSEPAVRETSPELWTRAEGAAARGADVHGLSTIGEIMTEMRSHGGSLYREALHMARVAREAYVTVGGKYPHPQTVTPGGVSATPDTTDFNLALLRVVKFLDFTRRTIAIWNDLANFFYEADQRYAMVGTGPTNFLDLGLWDDPPSYGIGAIANTAGPGQNRWSTPGAIVDGALLTTDVREIDAGVEELIDHSFYEEWGSGPWSTDAAGNELTPRHPSNKQTIPRPGGFDDGGRYSWCTAARWNGHPMETGAQARLWATALAGKGPHGALTESTGYSVRMTVPPAAMPATDIEWKVPQRWNALERNRARAYALAQAVVVAYEHVVTGLDLARRGAAHSKIFNKYKIPGGASFGVGYWGGARGYVSHYMQLADRVIESYQIVGPSTFSGSPRDGAGRPGPCEAAVMATPLVSSDPGQQGIDVLRTIRSFDLCMYCATQ